MGLFFLFMLTKNFISFCLLIVSWWVPGIHSMQKAMFQIVWKRRLPLSRYHDAWKWTITEGNYEYCPNYPYLLPCNAAITYILCWPFFIYSNYSRLLNWSCLHLTFQAGERILCRHPFLESKRAYVVPQHVEELLQCYWPGTSSMYRGSF